MTALAPSRVVLTVGNAMMGDDGAGPKLYDMMTNSPIPGWQAIDGGSAPENESHRVKALSPDTLVIVDAADMGLEPGEVRLIDADIIADMFIMTTHNLPLNFLIDQLKEEISEVFFIGIQPDLVAFAFPMTQAVSDAVDTVYQSLLRWRGEPEFERL
ncbi:Hydrogenase 3 maturation protease [Leminorella richardii]|uniref:Hydrogenase 3 maturation protease n=1 Tax=Leminorella richardii TaxID=158841 RepID=A0A2X4XV79_9GAMM|nr:hydrogenase maturation peptidase HycI [Leminorella richardii]SQI43985.1 Hydrogenase 3 maturation protease [Leminorella richardii]